ncbi:Fabp5p [Sparganum proliferum]
MVDSALEFSPGDAGCYNMQVKMGTMTHNINFKLGEEFQHTTLDGRSVKMVIKLDGKKLTIDQKGDKAMFIEDVVDGKNLTVTLKVGDVSCVRHYVKV